METFHWSVLLGGFTFFFLGLKMVRDALQAVAGDRMRRVLSRATTNRFLALGFGALVTVMLQSSGATAAILISFAETHLVGLTAAIAVLLGADIGTTLTVFLLSLHRITDYALLIIAAGFFWGIVSRGHYRRQIGAMILGFGLIFYGMDLMATAAAPLHQSLLALQAFGFFADNPIVTLILATLVAGALHSAGTIGMAIVLAYAGTINFAAAVPIVLGANVGTCITALLCGVSARVPGRRVAMAHTVTKLVGVAVVFPFIQQIIALVNMISAHLVQLTPVIDPGVAGQIVITHVLFNLALAIVFLPLIGFFAWWVRKAIPDRPEKEDEAFRPRYLDRAALETPALAFAQVKREILRIAGIVAGQLESCLKMFDRKFDTAEEVERIELEDDKIDALEKAARFYLARLSSEMLAEKEADLQLALLAIGQDLEEIGDTISRELVILAKKHAVKHQSFSDDGWRDLLTFHALVRESFELAIASLAQPAVELVTKARRHEEHLNDQEQNLRQSHLSRLHQGLAEAFETSSIHLDVLSNLRRIGAKTAHIVELSAQL